MEALGAAGAVPAAQVIVAIIPIVGIVMGAVVVFFFILWRHREIVRQIEAGVYRRPVFDIHLFSLLAGFLLAGTGLGLTLLFLFIEGVTYSLIGGVIPLALGAGLLGFYFTSRADKKKVDRSN
jgi:hypothetical protein